MGEMSVLAHRIRENFAENFVSTCSFIILLRVKIQRLSMSPGFHSSKNHDSASGFCGNLKRHSICPLVDLRKQALSRHSVSLNLVDDSCAVNLTVHKFTQPQLARMN